MMVVADTWAILKKRTSQSGIIAKLNIISPARPPAMFVQGHGQVFLKSPFFRPKKSSQCKEVYPEGEEIDIFGYLIEISI